jgi:3-isopropylmalate dehydrogenase
VAPTITQTAGWLECLVDPDGVPRDDSPLVGVLPGEGIGPEVVDAALRVLRRLEQAGGPPIAVEVGGAIGREAQRAHGAALTEDVVRFCDDVFARGGAILSGPGGGRYVYDLRRRLGLFLKLSPIQVRNGLADASPLRPELLRGIDLLVVRENLGGVYQGEANDGSDASGRVVRHAFSYAEADVRRFLAAAARLARSRRGELTVIAKEAGVPQVSDLWRECAAEAAEAQGVRYSLVDVDLMAYRLVRSPASFDVVAAPNLCGDVLGDLAAVLLGSRGISFGASYSPGGDGVYQTNHGAAHDIAGTGRANPVGQILSLAMLLRESLGLEREAAAVESAVRDVWRDGGMTDDVGGALGTGEMAELVAEAAAGRLAETPG